MTTSAGSVHETADVAPSASIASTARVWHYAQVRENARLGENVVVGRGAYIGTGVEIGDNCKIQNYALVYEPARLAAGVFVGPAVVLTNDHFPRAINPDGSAKSASTGRPSVSTSSRAHRSEPAARASHRSSSGDGHSSDPDRWSSRTFPTSRSSSAARRAVSVGRAGPVIRWWMTAPGSGDARSTARCTGRPARTPSIEMEQA